MLLATDEAVAAVDAALKRLGIPGAHLHSGDVFCQFRIDRMQGQFQIARNVPINDRSGETYRPHRVGQSLACGFAGQARQNGKADKVLPLPVGARINVLAPMR
ncbi:MAG: hypothetical protein WKF37_15365 [Bryobacteraceae bacterium]